MYCPRCNNYACGCMGGLANMAAQQQMGISNAQYLAYLGQQSRGLINDEIVKAYAAKPEKNKKLLLLRK